MNRPAQGAQTEQRSEASVNRASAFARPAPVPEVDAGAPLTRRQLREIAQAEQAAEQEAQQASQRAEAASPKEPERVLSRRELRERAAAAAAEQAAADEATNSVAPSKSSQVRPVPAVQPPAATGAIRALDDTGRLTPVRRVAVATGQSPAPVNKIPGLEPVPSPQQGQPAEQGQSSQPAGLNRVGVRESLAQVEAESAPRVYPQPGATPAPAMPTGQHTPLASGATATNFWTPVSEHAADVVPSEPASAASAQAASTAAPRGLSAPVVVAAVPADSWSAGAWQPIGAVQQQEKTARSAPSATSSAVTPAPDAEQDGLGVPQWGSVLGAGSTAHNPAQNPAPNMAQGFEQAPVAPQRAEQEDTESADPGGWLRYTPLQFLVLIVLGLVLGGLVWQLLSATSGSEAEAPQSLPGQEQVIEFEQTYV